MILAVTVDYFNDDVHKMFCELALFLASRFDLVKKKQQMKWSEINVYVIHDRHAVSSLPLPCLPLISIHWSVSNLHDIFQILLSPTRYLHLISCRLRITVTFFNLFYFCFVFVFFFVNIISSYFSILLFLFLYSSGVCFGLFCYFRTVNLLLFDYRRHAYRYLCICVCRVKNNI